MYHNTNHNHAGSGTNRTVGVWGVAPHNKQGDREGAQAPNMPSVGLTWHNPNSLVLVEGPEIAIRPVGIRRLPSEVAQVSSPDGDA